MKNKSELLADRLNAEGEPPTDDNLAAHPEGSDRGGYVQTFADAGGTAYWCFSNEKWLAFNSGYEEYNF